jgi:2-polyprenyl-3-methyl-5-hydroxy-6-metoxy-1,4-benzoquinol methylase
LGQDILNYQKWFYSQHRFIESKIKSRGDILEIGSGLGGFYSLLSQEDQKHYLGLELDVDSVNFANSYFKSGAFLNKSLEEFEQRDKFDVVYAFEVLEHLNNPMVGIEKISDLLEDGGVFVGTSPYPYKKNVLADETHNFVLHPENWKRLFLDNGFKSVEIFTMSFLPSLWRINKNFNIRLPFYLPFKYFISTCLIIAKK